MRKIITVYRLDIKRFSRNNFLESVAGSITSFLISFFIRFKLIIILFYRAENISAHELKCHFCN